MEKVDKKLLESWKKRFRASTVSAHCRQLLVPRHSITVEEEKKLKSMGFRKDMKKLWDNYTKLSRDITLYTKKVSAMLAKLAG